MLYKYIHIVWFWINKYIYIYIYIYNIDRICIYIYIYDTTMFDQVFDPQQILGHCPSRSWSCLVVLISIEPLESRLIPGWNKSVAKILTVISDSVEDKENHDGCHLLPFLPITDCHFGFGQGQGESRWLWSFTSLSDGTEFICLGHKDLEARE